MYSQKYVFDEDNAFSNYEGQRFIGKEMGGQLTLSAVTDYVGKSNSIDFPKATESGSTAIDRSIADGQAATRL